MNWKGICFDLDNTLFSHEEAFKLAIQDSFHTYLQENDLRNSEVKFEKFFKLFKKNSDRYWGLFEHKELSGTEYRRKRFMETMLTLNLPCSVKSADRFHTHYYEVVDDFSKPYPGLHELLRFLSNKQIRSGIITNGMLDTQFSKIEKIGASNWIHKNNIIVSEGVGVIKPHSGIFKLMEERLGLSKSDLLFIGDSWKHDVVGAIDAGWDAIFLNTRGESRKTDHEPIKEFHTLEEVKDYLTRQ